ncbi:MAG: metal ABC transporter permease [Planctomycetota bacterium]|jgi:ABC-type Mn2+/Zn2+ transport system permease subunit
MTILAHIDTTAAESTSLWPVYMAGIAIALQCALVSVFVVLRQMSFVGHGVSHAALAGVGLGAILGWTGNPMLVLVGLSCLGASLGMVMLTRRSGASNAEHDDTAIGIVLGAFMALGAVLLAWRASHPIEGIETDLHWEEVLFGSIDDVGMSGAWLAWLSCLAVGGVLFLTRRALLLWVYDPTTSRLVGVRDGVVQIILMAMITAIIVVSVRLAGVVLVTTMLILPGAIALRLTSRLGRVFLASGASSAAGMLLGITIAFWAELPPGACVVLVMTAAYGGVRLAGR